MSRIDSEKVNFGSSFVLPTSDDKLRVQELVNAKKVAQELIAKAQKHAESIVEEAKRNAQKHIDDAVAQANGTEQVIQYGNQRQKQRQEGHGGKDHGKTSIRAKVKDCSKQD